MFDRQVEESKPGSCRETFGKNTTGSQAYDESTVVELASG